MASININKFVCVFFKRALTRIPLFSSLPLFPILSCYRYFFFLFGGVFEAKPKILFCKSQRFNSRKEEIKRFLSLHMIGRVKKNESLLYYMPGFNQSAYTNYNYTPSLIDPKFLLDNRIRHVCGTDQLCAFDLLVSGSEGFASQTLNSISLYRSTSNDLIPGMLFIKFSFTTKLPSVLSLIFRFTSIRPHKQFKQGSE